jgi:hypothetical protein
VKKRDNKETGATSLGTFDCKQSVIWVEEGLSDDQTLSTLIHEAIEAIDFQGELKLEHSKICVLETGIYSLIMNNGIFKK